MISINKLASNIVLAGVVCGVFVSLNYDNVLAVYGWLIALLLHVNYNHKGEKIDRN